MTKQVMIIAFLINTPLRQISTICMEYTTGIVNKQA